MTIKFKKLHPDAVIPTKAHSTDAGFDLICVEIERQSTTNYTLYKCHTGIAIEMPTGYYAQVVPRSSIFKKNLILVNSPGTIDNGYHGEIICLFKGYLSDVYEVGDKIAQLIILPYPEIEFEEVDELSETDRGNKGFGSTGN